MHMYWFTHSHTCEIIHKINSAVRGMMIETNKKKSRQIYFFSFLCSSNFPCKREIKTTNPQSIPQQKLTKNNKTFHISCLHTSVGSLSLSIKQKVLQFHSNFVWLIPTAFMSRVLLLLLFLYFYLFWLYNNFRKLFLVLFLGYASNVCVRVCVWLTPPPEHLTLSPSSLLGHQPSGGSY